MTLEEAKKAKDKKSPVIWRAGGFLFTGIINHVLEKQKEAMVSFRAGKELQSVKIEDIDWIPTSLMLKPKWLKKEISLELLHKAQAKNTRLLYIDENNMAIPVIYLGTKHHVNDDGDIDRTVSQFLPLLPKIQGLNPAEMILLEDRSRLVWLHDALEATLKPQFQKS